MDTDGRGEDGQVAGGFFARRWRAEIPLRTLFWRDMVLVGTGINILTTVASLIAFASGAETWQGLAIYLLPLPYNVFLTVAAWRRADREGGGWAGLARLGAVLWLLAATVI